VKQAKRRDITRELEAQYLRLLDMGCVPDHADSHAGTLYGTNGRLFFLNAYALCKKYGLPFRFATEDSFLTRQFGGDVSHFFAADVGEELVDIVYYTKSHFVNLLLSRN
jgi:predicted glycoside hydrolase/deacetylase ChbG (UPF0249 family)